MLNFLTTAKVAELLNMSPRHIVRLLAKGQIKALGKMPGKTGGYFFDPIEVERLLCQRDITAAKR
ncbi:MAG: helix-turn-helix domain-containing protein [Propionibacteriaceae bacterium]|jgi:excisionase family DNA binding protein|nr:helix-turn-helix domain-containing protein [Propionibacteriaceae bacterium]